MTGTKLRGIPETMLIPLWARAVEKKQDNPIIVDEKAAEMLAGIDYDFDKFKKSKLSQIGVCIRTYILDNAVSAFLKKHEDAVVINLGAGLDTRYERIRPDKAKWIDLDVSESITLRKKFFHETENNFCIESSMFEEDWMNSIDARNRPVLFIAEGVLMYFDESLIQSFFSTLADRFPGAEMLFEMLAPHLKGKASKHDSLKTIENAPEFKWSLMNAQDVELYNPGIKFIDQWHLFDHFKNRAPVHSFIFSLPFIKPRMAQRIVHIRFS